MAIFPYKKILTVSETILFQQTLRNLFHIQLWNYAETQQVPRRPSDTLIPSTLNTANSDNHWCFTQQHLSLVSPPPNMSIRQYLKHKYIHEVGFKHCTSSYVSWMCRGHQFLREVLLLQKQNYLS